VRKPLLVVLGALGCLVAAMLLVRRSGTQTSGSARAGDAVSPGELDAGSRRASRGPLAPEVAREAAASAQGLERESSAPSAASLRGRVIDTAGAAVGGARVQLIGWTREDVEREPAWQADDWGPLLRERRHERTDDTGTFQMDPLGSTPHGLLLWASGPGLAAACHLVESTGPESRSVLIEVSRAPPLLVTVLDAGGVPVSDATVRVFGTTPARALAGADGRTPERARRLFEDAYETNAAGTAELGRFPEEVVIVASRGDSTSLPWRGIPGATLKLSLGSSFTVGGSVSLPDWSHLDYRGERRIRIDVEGPDGRRSLGCVRGVTDGPWGPVRLPLLPATHYSVGLEGSPILPSFREFAAPRPGAHVVVDLAAELGHPLALHVTDERGQGIPDAEAASHWVQEGRERVLRRRGDRDGYIDNWSFPEGVVVRTLVTAPGFAGRWAPEVTFPEASPRTHPVTLKRAAALVGRCVHRGEPVRDFEVVVWEPLRSGFTQVRRLFRDRVDGSFEFEDAPEGPIAVSAASASLPFSGPVHARAPSSTPIVIELASPLRGAGQVVDLETGEPVRSARVQALAVLPEGTLGLWGAVRSVDQEGRFDLDAFVTGQNAVRVQAEGYALREARAFALDGAVDFGRILLDRARPLELQLVADGPFDFTRLSAVGTDNTPLPRRRFDGSGLVRFPDASAGTRFLEIEGSPQATWVSLRLELEAQKPWRFQHRVSGRRRLVVEVVGDSAEVASIVGLSVSYVSGGGVHTELGLPLQLEEDIVIEGIDADSACVSVMGPVRVNASTLSELRGDQLFARLDLAAEPFVLRVVDPAGAPVPGVLVRVSDSQPSALYLVGTTDPEGACLFTGIPARTVLVSLEHESLGRLLGAPIDGAAQAAELVLGSEAGLHLVVADGAMPIPGVEARALVSSIGSRWSLLGYSDEAGRVRAGPLGEGRYTVSLAHAECWPVSLEVEARADPPPHAVQIRRRGSLALVLVNPEGVFLGGRPLELLSEEFETDVARWIEEGRVTSRIGLVSDAAGEIRIERLPRGPYLYRLPTSSGEVLEGRCEVQAGELARVVVIVP